MSLGLCKWLWIKSRASLVHLLPIISRRADPDQAPRAALALLPVLRLICFWSLQKNCRSNPCMRCCGADLRHHQPARCEGCCRGGGGLHRWVMQPTVMVGHTWGRTAPCGPGLVHNSCTCMEVWCLVALGLTCLGGAEWAARTWCGAFIPGAEAGP